VPQSGDLFAGIKENRRRRKEEGENLEGFSHTLLSLSSVALCL
jgi:hypothetical protein